MIYIYITYIIYIQNMYIIYIIYYIHIYKSKLTVQHGLICFLFCIGVGSLKLLLRDRFLGFDH